MRHVEVRPGVYRDSVRLMQISSVLSVDAEVDEALVAMATRLNLDLAAGMGFDVPAGTGPNDLLVAFSAANERAMASALDRLDRELSPERKGTPLTLNGVKGAPANAVRPRTTGSAARGLDPPGVALVSTPGRYAFVEAMDALDAGLSVMVFSDNVPVAQEVHLKRTALGRGLLVMGPDCGTAVVGGVGLGFANVVRPGPVGIVAASGTGAQHVMCLLGAAGVGISHCLGVGGRDLSAAVGGISTRAALDALDADPATELIVLIGKTPAAGVAAAIAEHSARLSTPVVVSPLGPGEPDLTAIVEGVLARLGRPVPPWPSWAPAADPVADRAGGWLRGLFSGGTLCTDAMAIAAAALGPIRSNVPLRPEWRVGPSGRGHVMIDLGDDEYTVGRPHPMIDFGPRLRRLATEAADPRCRALLLDVVLGHAAHPDPAAELAPAIQAALAARHAAPSAREPSARDTALARNATSRNATSREAPLTAGGAPLTAGGAPLTAGDAAGSGAPLSILVSLIGTPEDPQDLSRQAATLRGAGAWVYQSNAAAARRAVQIVAESPQ